MKRMIKMNIRVIVTDEYIFNIGGGGRNVNTI